MAKNRDPFADAKLTELLGLDQRLFSEHPETPPRKAGQASKNVTRSERKKVSGCLERRGGELPAQILCRVGLQPLQDSDRGKLQD